MNILLIGSGGREHALAFKIVQSKLCKKLYVATGNAGIAAIAECVDLDIKNHKAVIAFIKTKNIQFVVIGPEAPLVDGLTDSLSAENIICFGPSQKAAALEGSKGFMKDLCKKYNIPTASYERFSNFENAAAYLETQTAPIVLKQDGLAAGKGVVVALTMDEARAALQEFYNADPQNFSVVVEEFLDGEEVSYFVLTDGVRAIPLTSAQDHKRAFDGDKGPNTGGMGAYSPAPIFTKELEEEVLQKIITPTIEAMQKEGAEFSGVLFAGLMIVNGAPKLLEYNARFGDPECQTLMMRIDSDIVELLYAVATKANEIPTPRFNSQTALCVVMASKGYPAAFEKMTLIEGLNEAAASNPALQIFHAATILKDQKLYANGGRVLGITSLGDNIIEAQKNAYTAVELIHWNDGFYRRDIGYRAVALLQKNS